MGGGPTVLLGQGEQYDDPDDWLELVRARRIRRGVDVAVRRYGLTALMRPEDVPELAALLDEVDPPGPPSRDAPPPPSRPSAQAPPSPPAAPPPLAAEPAAAEAAPGRPRAPPLPTAAPRRRRSWPWDAWPWLVAGGGVLLLLRLCAADGFGPAPALGRGAERSGGSGREAAACAHPHGWLAKAACDDPELGRLRPALAHAYSARAAGLADDERADLAAEQARWQASRESCRTAADPGACLEPRYRRRLAELGAAPPAVRGLDGGSATKSARGAGAARAVAAVDAPQWVRRPTAEEIADVLPERAERLEVDGRARLACRVTADGGLTACDILSEDPPDYGFGAAALRLSRFYRLRPTGSDGRPAEGARVEVPVSFGGG